MTERSVLLRGGRVVGSAGARPASAMFVDGPTIAWVGADDDAPSHADEVVLLEGALVLPTFVDAHVHATHTGLALSGLDLSVASSLTDALDRVAAYATTLPAGGVVLGSGWEELRWPERRAPVASELDRAAAGRPVYLARVDVHSAVASSALLACVPNIATMRGAGRDGLVRLEAHHAVRRAAYAAVDGAMRVTAQRVALRRAAEAGIGAVHEMGGPDIGGADDFAGLLALSAAELTPEVVGYWGELGGTAAARDLGARGAGGDLFVDGTFGSHTAWLSEPYADEDTVGHTWIEPDDIAGHIRACVHDRMQPGFHAIGDGAVGAVVDAQRLVAAEVGTNAVASLRPRLEHAEFVRDISGAARHGVVASVQPAFDAAWGGPTGMYADRLGTQRAQALNPFAALSDAGVTLAFGSDAPVTPLDPWGTLRAAVHHCTPGFGVGYGAAFTAHTVGGWRAAHIDNAGTLAPGAPASYAIWDAPAVDDAAGLPELDAPDPTCLRTVVRGEVVYDRCGVFA